MATPAGGASPLASGYNTPNLRSPMVPLLPGRVLDSRCAGRALPSVALHPPAGEPLATPSLPPHVPQAAAQGVCGAPLWGRALHGPVSLLPQRPLPHPGQLPLVHASGARAGGGGAGFVLGTSAAGAVALRAAPLPRRPSPIPRPPRYRFYLLFVLFYVIMVGAALLLPVLLLPTARKLLPAGCLPAGCRPPPTVPRRRRPPP